MNHQIHYQTNRNTFWYAPGYAWRYYPEDEKTPIQRLKWIKSLDDDTRYIIITACPYIVEGCVKQLKGEIEFFIDGVKCELNDIFELFASPMKEMTRLYLKL